jgi:hypothetical protein
MEMRFRKRVTASVLTAALLCTSAGSVPVYGAPAGADIDETMYVNLDYYGKTTKVNVVKGVNLNGLGEITDYGNYINVENMSTSDAPVLGDGSVTWNLPEGQKGRFYYKCTMDNEQVVLPWDFDVSYKLNGVPTDGDKLAGANGLIEINVKATPNDNAVYEFESSGALKTAKWLENTGGGAYNAGCYDDVAQDLFGQLGDEKKEQYFDAYPDREREYDGDNHTSYDRYAGFIMDMKLNKIAQSRLEAAMEKGYADGRVTGEGTIEDTLASIPYRKNASCLEVYVRDCEDTDEAYDKIMNVTGRKYTSKSDRKYTLQYYRYMGMAHEEKNGHHWFMVLFMR